MHDIIIRSLFETFREHHPEIVFSSMETIMIRVFEESDDISLGSTQAKDAGASERWLKAKGRRKNGRKMKCVK
ncbi:hypothetical protein MTR_1g014280 [Medicago truncatula]|uniref:Uncharacterized protein n=1 Tax=Medicago truncatula TaxID=3880 RepID=G7I8A0_MEDTR|nr:hypothetical protein MTR_1g014280 [Medicago truncatula]